MVEYTTDNRVVSGSTPLIPILEVKMSNDSFPSAFDRDFTRVAVILKVSGEYTEFVRHIMLYNDLHKFRLFIDDFNASIQSVSLEIEKIEEVSY